VTSETEPASPFCGRDRHDSLSDMINRNSVDREKPRAREKERKREPASHVSSFRCVPLRRNVTYSIAATLPVN